MDNNLLSSLNPRDDIHELDYGQHLLDAGYGGSNQPTIEDLVRAIPPARKPEPVKEVVVSYKDIYVEERRSAFELIQQIAMVCLLIGGAIGFIFLAYLFLSSGLWILIFLM